MLLQATAAAAVAGVRRRKRTRRGRGGGGGGGEGGGGGADLECVRCACGVCTRVCACEYVWPAAVSMRGFGQCVSVKEDNWLAVRRTVLGSAGAFWRHIRAVRAAISSGPRAHEGTQIRALVSTAQRPLKSLDNTEIPPFPSILPRHDVFASSRRDDNVPGSMKNHGLGL